MLGFDACRAALAVFPSITGSLLASFQLWMSNTVIIQATWNGGKLVAVLSLNARRCHRHSGVYSDPRRYAESFLKLFGLEKRAPAHIAKWPPKCWACHSDLSNRIRTE